MNRQPFSNGFPHRRVEQEAGMNKAKPAKKSHYIKKNGGESGIVDSHARDLSVYLTTCKIGHHVEAHLKNGSVYSRIFHAADVEKIFGIVLKMACLIKEGSLQGMKSRSPLVCKPPSKIFIIPADELVQLIAKGEKLSELLTDSSISQSYHVDSERELKRWVLDEDVPDCPDLENVFVDPWKKRGWNHFEVNKTLFGVTSTFDEELYTTKLERGPRTRKLEEQALRIAREIEGESTRDLHVAEERGIQLSGKFDIDEETKYSSVCPVNGFDDSGYEEEEKILLDSCNDSTFGDSSAYDGMKSVSNLNKNSWQLMFEHPSKDLPAPDNNIRNESQFGEQRNNKSLKASHYKKPSEESVSGLEDINEDAPTPDPACLQRRAYESHSSTDGKLVGQLSARAKSESAHGLPGSSISKNSEISTPASTTSKRPILSPSYSIGCFSSEKSTLNPNAKFRLNPNAKSFKPSPTATRPQSPVQDVSFYYPPVPPMPGTHILYGPIGGALPGRQQQQQPMMYNATQHGPNQTFYSPHGPQVMVGQQRQVLFMPPQSPYQQEMSYKGRDVY